MNKRSMICSQLYKHISMSYVGHELVQLCFMAKEVFQWT